MARRGSLHSASPAGKKLRLSVNASKSPTTGATHALEQSIAEREAELRDWLVRAGMSHERRILRLPIGRLTWHYPQPDILQLEFVLPAGCFATVLVRELVDLVTLDQADSLCVF